jgi:iron(III) transport system substrate-binding protein
VSSTHRGDSRRQFLKGGLAASVGLSGLDVAASSTRAWAASQPPWQVQWTALQAAAKKEGKLSALTGVGTGFRNWIQACQTALGIEIDLQQQPNSEEIANKIIAERSAGIYSFDIICMTPSTALPRLKPIGALDSMRALLFRPDVVNAKVWPGGFDAAWSDSAKVLGFPLSESLIMPGIDTNLVRPGEIKNARSLLDPKWKGKISLGEIRSTSTRALMTSIRLRDGDDTVRRILVDQQPVYSGDFRQQAEGLVRDTFALAQGPQPTHLQEFLDAGIGRNVQFVDIPDVSYISHTYSLWVANRAPHPNATKLFVNWALTKAGQEAFSSTLSLNAFRSDVAVLDAKALPRPGQWYLHLGSEADLPELEKTRVLMTRVTGVPA